MKNIIASPAKLYMIWILICVIFALLIPAFSIGHHTSSQFSFTLGIYSIIALVCGTFLISLFNILSFKKRAKKDLMVDGFIAVLTGMVILLFI
jgi:hypothetical protein